MGQNSEILFYGQPAGVILADTFALANSAASKVKITYVESGKVLGEIFNSKNIFSLRSVLVSS